MVDFCYGGVCERVHIALLTDPNHNYQAIDRYYPVDYYEKSIDDGVNVF